MSLPSALPLDTLALAVKPSRFSLPSEMPMPMDALLLESLLCCSLVFCAASKSILLSALMNTS